MVWCDHALRIFGCDSDIFGTKISQFPKSELGPSVSQPLLCTCVTQVEEGSILYGDGLWSILFFHGPQFAGRASLASRKSKELAAKYVTVLFQMHSQFVQLICTICNARPLVLKRTDRTH